MVFHMDETRKINVTNTAQDIEVAYRAFMLSNTGSGVVYIKSKDDGEDATTSDFAVPAGSMVSMPLTCNVLSVIGSGSISIIFGSVLG